MEKRVLLAIVLSFLVLYGYQALFPPVLPPAVPERAPAEPSVPPPALTAPEPSAGQQPQSAPLVEATAEALVSDSEARDIVFENSAVRAEFSNRGAVLKSWRLKHYRGRDDAPLDLVPTNVPPESQRPFALSVDDPAVTAKLQQALYQPSATRIDVQEGEAALAFEYQDKGGLTARKEFRFSADQPYVIRFSATVITNDTPLVPTIHWGPALGDGLAGASTGLYNPPPQPIFYRDGDVTRVGTDDVKDYAVQEGVFGFAGVDDHYFLSAALPGTQPLHLRYASVQVPGATPDDKVARFVDWSARFPATRAEAPFFFGPKDFEILASVHRDLVRAIHFGVLSPLVVPLLRALRWIHSYVGNYGWSIIVLTAIINLVMFPLRHKSVVSMRRMQEIQPEVKAIQERYSKLKMSDPARQKMNVELMNLYRERGVNPASGCVPMLLTLPVLFAFYSMLSVAIELRGAPFVGWIRDLSAHDPLFITPVLMGATQFLQTRMTPTTADPMQQKMMMFMPVIFMFFFLWAPSGLVLYWTASNLWAIGQQALTNRIIGPPPQRHVRPPAERRVKSAGAGRSDQAAKERK